MEGEKKRGRPQKRSCDSSDSSILLAFRRLDVEQRNETFFSERTHPYRDSSHNSSQNYINSSINLRIVNKSNMNYSLSSSQILSTANSTSFDFIKLNLFNFKRLFDWSDVNDTVKLRVIGLLYPPEDPEFHTCPKCNGDLHRSEEHGRVLGYRYR